VAGSVNVSEVAFTNLLMGWFGEFMLDLVKASPERCGVR
jgi:hypothetical protein